MKIKIRMKASLLLLGSLLSASCRNSQHPAAVVEVTNSAVTDYSRPYLSDEKMQRFLDSMKEEHNPLALIFRPGGRVRDSATLGNRIDEFNTFARKYGFQDYQDYIAVWGRITAAKMQIAGAETFEGMIKDAQTELKKPDLDPGMRKIYGDQLTDAQKNLDNLKNGKSGLAMNVADLELIKKYQPQIDAAQKKYDTAG